MLLCPTLGDPIDGSPVGSSVPGILQARLLEWVAISFFNSLKNIYWSIVGKAINNPPLSVEDTGDVGSIPGSGKCPGGGNDSPLQYSCLENPMDRGAWWATVHEVIRESGQLGDWAHKRSSYHISELSCTHTSWSWWVVSASPPSKPGIRLHGKPPQLILRIPKFLQSLNFFFWIKTANITIQSPAVILESVHSL